MELRDRKAILIFLAACLLFAPRGAAQSQSQSQGAADMSKMNMKDDAAIPRCP